MRLGVITMVRNERRFLPIWLRHYGQIVGPQNLFVIDNESGDGLIDRRDIVNLIRIASPSFDETRRAAFVSKFHESLLGVYDAAIYTDVDELLLADPETGLSLPAFIETHLKTTISPVGLNVIQNQPAGEQPLDPHRPLFAQRRYVQFDAMFCKPLIAAVPTRWRRGFHEIDAPETFVAGLYLFHLRAADRDIARERWQDLEAAQTVAAVGIAPGSRFTRGVDEYLDHIFSAVGRADLEVRPFEFTEELRKLNHSRRSVLNNVLNNLRVGRGGDYVRKHSMAKSFHLVPERFEGVIALS